MAAATVAAGAVLDRSVKHGNTSAMPTVQANGIDLYFDAFGPEDAPALLLVPGLGAHGVGYDDELCEAIVVAAGVRLLRYDNRDVGLSTHLDGAPADVLSAMTAALAGEPVDAPYTLSDMAADGIGLLDALGIDDCHVVGASMGGMIAQTMAIEHPDRIRSLTSIMSTTGERDVGAPDPDCLSGILSIMAPVGSREERIEQGVGLARLIGTPSVFDEERARARSTLFVDRADDPDGTARQMVAILAAGSCAEGLREVRVPTVVLHGDLDPLVDISGGRRTAELVPGARIEVLDRMGHDLPPAYWDRVVGGVAAAVTAVDA